jgi:hypothetical protein
MKKNLLALLILLINFNTYAQTQTISFETSEGYSLGDIHSQNEWERFSMTPPFSSEIINTGAATHGNNYLKIEGRGNNRYVQQTFAGYNKTEYSFDFKIDTLNESQYLIGFKKSGMFSHFAGFYILPDGNVHTAPFSPVSTGFTATPGQWNNYKVVVDLTARTVEYFINNLSVGIITISDAQVTDFNMINFSFSDWQNPGTNLSCSVDNIKITNAGGTLGTSEVSSKSFINIFPNPTPDFINIKAEDKIDSVEIFDLSGKLILKDHKGKNRIEVSTLENGIYMVKINTVKGSITRKIIKN